MMSNHKVKQPLSLNYLIGIDLPLHIKEEIYLFLKQNCDSFKNHLNWIKHCEYHISLAYMGKITETQRERLINASNTIDVAPFTIEIKGLGFNPPGKNPKHLWVGIDEGRNKIKLFSDLIRTELTKKSGLIPKNDFYPHITIGKIINPNLNKIEFFNFIAQNWNYSFGSFKINNFHLYRITDHGYVHNHKVELKTKNYYIWK